MSKISEALQGISEEKYTVISIPIDTSDNTLKRKVREQGGIQFYIVEPWLAMSVNEHFSQAFIFPDVYNRKEECEKVLSHNDKAVEQEFEKLVSNVDGFLDSIIGDNKISVHLGLEVAKFTKLSFDELEVFIENSL